MNLQDHSQRSVGKMRLRAQRSQSKSWRWPNGADRRIYGIDFSGAKDAGNKIWIAKGVPVGDRLLIEECFRAAGLPNSGKRVETCLPALVHLIRSETNAAFGFDFPFGLPASLVKEKTWEQFVAAFPEKYRSPEAFRESCRQANLGGESKRKTDTEARTPFSPYNLRLFKQTYHGISGVLFPLVRDGGACVLPFSEPVAGKPWILEICPASTLKHLMKKRVPSYKGPKEVHRESRRQLLANVLKERAVFGKNKGIKDMILSDRGGDALDSVIAAVAAFNVIQKGDVFIPDDNGYWKIEGYVYA